MKDIGMEKDVQAFEKEITHYLGIPEEYVICVNTGTSALHLGRNSKFGTSINK